MGAVTSADVIRRIGLSIILMVGGYFVLTGCATEVVPSAPGLTVKDTDLNQVSNHTFLTKFSTDFQRTYQSEKPWTSYHLIYVGVMFLTRNGIEKYRGRASDRKEAYPGIQQFMKNVEEANGPWSYLGKRAVSIQDELEKREQFRSELHFTPYEDFVIAMMLRSRYASSDAGIPSFGESVEEQPYKPSLMKALVLLLTSQYFVQSLRELPDPADREKKKAQEELEWVLSEWKRVLVRLRSQWNPRFDITLVSRDEMMSFRTFAGEDNTDESTERVEGNGQQGESGTIPFREIYSTKVDRILPQIRDLHTRAIQSFVEERLDTTLRRRMKSLAYAVKFRLFQDVSGTPERSSTDVSYYAQKAFDEIDRMLRIR